MHISPSEQSEKLKKLLAVEGLTVDELAEAGVMDSICPAICIVCDATTEMEGDQTAGYCERCGKNTVVSGLILAGLI